MTVKKGLIIEHELAEYGNTYNPYSTQLEFSSVDTKPEINVGQLNVISLFSGCGGMDIGFEGNFKVHPSLDHKSFDTKKGVLPRTRFKTVFANDIRQGAKKCWENFHKPDGDIFKLCSIVDFVKGVKAGSSNFPECDILTGGFPCQDFSVAGKRKGFSSDKSDMGVVEIDKPSDESRGMLYMWMRQAIELSQPKMFIAENVKGLVSLGEAKEIISNDFSNIGEGYFVFPPQVLSAVDYGIPQTRERVIFIGIKKSAIDKNLLKKIEANPVDPRWNPYPTKLESKTPTLEKLLNSLDEPEFSNDLSQRAYSKAKWYGKHCQGQTEVDLNAYSPTIRSEHHGNIEFRRLRLENGGKYKEEFKRGLKERRLSVRECARIQTFPDDYEFVFNNEYGSVSGSEAYKLIGNAVPPLLAFQIARRIEEIWDNLFKVQS